VRKEDGAEEIQVEKCTLIHDTSSEPIAIEIAGTTLSQAIEDNIINMTREINELHEINKKLEEENAQLKA